MIRIPSHLEKQKKVTTTKEELIYFETVVKQRYENGDNFNGMEDTLYRIDIINKFISKFEKYFEYCMNSGTKASEECLNKFFAIVESMSL